MDRIDRPEAEQDHVRLHVGPASYRVREIDPWSHGDPFVVVQDGTELRMSRRCRARGPELSP